MCGIVGLFLKQPDLEGQLGALLLDMMDVLSDRGPDSAGFAIYGAGTEGRTKLTLSGPSDAAKSPSDVRHYKHANYKFNDSGWFDDKRTHLWGIEVANGRATPLTSGDDWNDSDPQWSPDSRRIAFVSDRTGRAFDEGHNTDVWVIDAKR